MKMTFVPTAVAVLLAAVPAQGQFRVNKNLYSETANPAADIAAAEKQAQREHKRILLDFGGNWCGDCQVLDYNAHQAPSADLIAKHYVVVHVNIGHMDRHVDIADKYHVPIAHGVPSLAVLDARGKLLYAEKPKEFEHASAEELAAFLDHWKG